MYRFLVVDDHPLFREALRAAVTAAYPDAAVVEATGMAEAIAFASAPDGFDLALLDLSMPGTTGLDGVLEFRGRFPRLPVMVVSGLDDPRIVREALACGIAGFVPKASRKAELVDAITAVMGGAVHVPAEIGQRALPATEAADREQLLERLKTLTPAQLRVLQMLRQGLLNKQIAFELQVGETTVKAHVSEILRKLGVISRTQAVIEAARVDFDRIAVDADEAG